MTSSTQDLSLVVHLGDTFRAVFIGAAFAAVSKSFAHYAVKTEGALVRWIVFSVLAMFKFSSTFRRIRTQG
jgi:hypothetical protein